MEVVGESIGDAANALGMTEVVQFMYDIDDPHVAALLQGKEEQTLDALIQKGVDPSVAKNLLTNPEFYSIVGDIIANGDLIGSEVAADNQVANEVNVLPQKLGEPLEILITESHEITPAEKVLIGLDTTKAFVETLPTEEAEAALLAVGILTGGPIRAAVEVGKGVAVDTVLGDTIRDAQEAAAHYISAGVQGVDVETHKDLLVIEERYEEQLGEGHSTILQSGSEFGLEVIGLGAGILGGTAGGGKILNPTQPESGGSDASSGGGSTPEWDTAQTRVDGEFGVNHPVKALKEEVTLKADDIRFSQNSVSFKKKDRITGEKYTYDDLVSSMKKDGWKGEAVDVVKMPDGKVTSMDNTRIRAAREAGVDVKANVRDYNAPISSEMKKARGWENYSTWGEAITGRIQKQSGGFSKKNPLGSIDAPKLTGNKK